MELSLNIYKLKGKYVVTDTDEVEREARVKDFELTTAACEDILNLINIDMFSGGLSALSDERKKELIINIITNGLPMFKEIIVEVFDLSEDEARRTKNGDITKVAFEIVKYAFSQLVNSVGGKKSKN